MCNTRNAFESCSIEISYALSNLVELSIDYCNDLIKLPDRFCNITILKKLSITNCHKLSAIPQDIGKLENLEVPRLCSCSDLGDAGICCRPYQATLSRHLRLCESSEFTKRYLGVAKAWKSSGGDTTTLTLIKSRTQILGDQGLTISG
ncbi:putative disease resistance protein [Trifolium repens]|jgi:hypothetical protein|nr:putative disease resistance protein [Trifolium repens]